MRLSLTLTLCLVVFVLFGQELPLGYITHYENSFNSTKPGKNTLFSGNTNYKVSNGKIELTKVNDTIYDFATGATMLVDNNIFGDFIAKTELNYSGETNDSLSGIVFIAGLRDSSNYYYVRMNEYGAYFNQVYKGVESTIEYNPTLIIPKNKTITLQITRDILTRSIQIKYNGSEAEFTDPNLVMGYIGFGVSGYTLGIDNITVWAPTSIAKPVGVFR